MATYQELRTRSQQVRDEQNIGGNTALRVGQLLMDIVKYFNDNDEAASEYLQQHFAMVNDGTHLLNWQQSPIVILHTMGETYDDGDFSALSQGENYYRAGFIMEANGQGGGINGETPKVNVLYVNLANDTLYTWNGASFDAITSGGGGSISGDDILKNAYYLNGNLVLVFETENGDKTVTIPVNFDASNYVPTSRTVNNKALSNNITLSQSDIPGLVAALAAKIGYSDDEWLQVKAGAMQAATAVPNTTTVNGKQLSNNIVIGMADIPGLLQAIANAGSGAVSVIQPDPADGTFIIRVGSTDYTINLNHTHENMAKLIVCEESDLPSTLDPATIYAITDSGETEIEKLIIRGMEFAGGGGTPSTDPRIMSPIGTQIDFNGASTKTVTVRATNLSEALTIAVTGMTANLQTISANDAENGVQLTLTKGQNFQTGTLRIYSSEVNKSWNVIDSQGYQSITAVKLTGTQWLQTDYRPNALTEFTMDVKFTANAHTGGYPSLGGSLLNCDNNSGDGKKFKMYLGSNRVGTSFESYLFSFVNEDSVMDGSTYQQIRYNDDPSPHEQFVVDHSIISYTIGASKGLLSFSNSLTSQSVNTSKKTSTMDNDMKIGYNGTAILQSMDLTIYSLVITESNVIVRNYVPRIRNGVPGLLDIAENGSGEFISSQTVTALEYIE